MSARYIPILLLILLSQNLIGATLTEKLTFEWQKRELAKKYFTEKAGKEKSNILRDEWENLLKSYGEFAFTPSDIELLKKQHTKKIEEHKLFAEKRSLIDIEKVEKENLVEQFCKEFPKGGMLHIHPWGTMDRETVSEILSKVNPKVNVSELIRTLYNPASPFILYPTEIDFLNPFINDSDLYFEKLGEENKNKLIDLFFLPLGQHGFNRFLGVFTIISNLVFYKQNDVNPEAIMYDGFFRRAKNNNLDYIEISDFIFNPESEISGLENWAKDIKLKYDIDARIIASFNRMKENEFNRKAITKLLSAPKSNILVGINFVNDEEYHPAFEKGQGIYSELLYAKKQNKSNLRATIHAGELGDVRNIRDALIMGAERIGHGVKLMEDVVTLEYTIGKNVPIEANILSNYYLKVVNDIKLHPFLKMLRLGLKVSLSTDDEGIFKSDISKECESAVNNTDITYYELKELSQNSIDSSFADDETKKRISTLLKYKFSQFEIKWTKYKK